MARVHHLCTMRTVRLYCSMSSKNVTISSVSAPWKSPWPTSRPFYVHLCINCMVDPWTSPVITNVVGGWYVMVLIKTREHPPDPTFVPPNERIKWRGI